MNDFIERRKINPAGTLIRTRKDLSSLPAGTRVFSSETLNDPDDGYEDGEFVRESGAREVWTSPGHGFHGTGMLWQAYRFHEIVSLPSDSRSS